MKKKNTFILKALIIVLGLAVVISSGIFKTESVEAKATWWKFQAIDTMKYSRDVAREKLNDPSYDKVINQQVKDIADTGATHVGIAAPYDEEFYPFLKRWVDAARRHNLNVWFRGNWAGWEKWFEYPKITRAEHIQKTRDFILNHRDIFADGDVFSPCPECENGGPGDPRLNGDVVGHRKFLIDEHRVTKEAFKQIGKSVASNYASMNGDVARLIMDKKTTAQMDGIVTVDHYVGSAERLVRELQDMAKNSGGKIVLGEFGAPIPDLNGNMTEAEQAAWVKDALMRLVEADEVVGVSYWTNMGGSTALWNQDGSPRQAVEAIKSVYNAPIARGTVVDEAGVGIKNTYIIVGDRRYLADAQGKYEFPYFGTSHQAQIEAQEFKGKTIEFNTTQAQTITLEREKESFGFKVRKFFSKLLNRFKS